MYSGTIIDDLMKTVEKAERELETREAMSAMKEELSQARVYTLIWNVPVSPNGKYLPQGVA